MKKLLVSAAFAVLALFPAYAQNAGKGYTTREYPWLMRSVAALGMGNAFHAKSDSKYAPFYNPAGLARVQRETWRLDIFPILLAFDNNARRLSSDVIYADTGNDEELADIFRKHITNAEYIDASFYPSFLMKNFTAGIFGVSHLSGEVANPVLPEVNADAVIDAGAVTGLAQSFVDGRLQAGAALRVQHRWSFEHSYLFSDFIDDTITDIDTDEIKKSLGAFLDMGVIFNFWTDGWNPRMGLTANNLGTNSMGTAQDLPWSLTVSFGLSPSVEIPSLCELKTEVLLDFIDVTHNFEEDNDIAKRVNAGIELWFDTWPARVFKFRGGIHQGYPTLGLGIEIEFLQLNYAHYSEELGAYAGQRRDTRHGFELTLSL
ncbi:MAG: hypothetical protein LBK13_06110 [Spirochaetales bacterium]|jgi:hypothetical protein|nr:hypothetical protein [Spirochaetales bacterium]